LWRLSIALFGLASVFVLAIAGMTLWVLNSFPVEPQKTAVQALGSRFEARKGEALGPIGPLKVGEAAQHSGGEGGMQGQPGVDARAVSIASLGEAGSSPAGPAPTSVGRIDAAAGADQPQRSATEAREPQPASRSQEISAALADSRRRMQCSIDSCAARYRSFNAADCTYQPYGGGPRRVCDLSTRSGEPRPETARAATEPRSEAKETLVAERPDEAGETAMPARAGAQCNVDLCAAKYASFHRSDCTYQPYGGGPRQICER
jgi:hypothetical protein